MFFINKFILIFMDFTGIFNAIISAFGADKTLGEASADAVPDKKK